MGISFFRYPGGKSKLQNVIISALKTISAESGLTEYREPFFGGGSIGLKFVDEVPCKKLWLNDRDPGIWSIWKSVIEFPEAFIKAIEDVNTNWKEPENAYSFFQNLKNDVLHQTKPDNEDAIVQCALKKLLVHQTSYSGLGTKAGGPIGGLNQTSDYKIDCRWSPSYMCKKIRSIHKKFAKYEIKCTDEDFSLMLGGYPAIVYLDPPYYQKGGDLYQFSFQKEDHVRLARILQEADHEWVLSYDACDEINALYDWANIMPIDVNYTITSTIGEAGRKASTKTELLITPAKYKNRGIVPPTP